MQKSLITILVAAALFPWSVSASGGEIRVTPDGKVAIKGAAVIQVAGTNFFTKVSWGDVFLRVTIVTNSSTKITKRYGEASVAQDIKEGDILDLEGVFAPAATSFIVNATSIVDNALQKETLRVAGRVTAVFSDRDEFSMTTTKGNSITMAASGASIIKGVIPITVGQLKIGDKITSADGTYDFSTKTHTPTSIKVYQDQSIFIPHNFQGTIKSISSPTLPSELTVALTTKEYVVRITDKTKTINKNKETISFSRFLVGDKVRFYGTIRQDNLSIVDDVEVLRDLSF